MEIGKSDSASSDSRKDMKLRGVVFFLTTVVVSRVIESISQLHADEAWLLAAILGVLVAYWISPIPKEKRLRGIGVYLLLIFGIYFFGFKVAELFAGWVGYRLAVFLCLAVYASCCWFFVIRRVKWMT